MTDLIRDAPIGQLIRFLTRNKVLLYPEEKPDFQCPMCYADPAAVYAAQRGAKISDSSTSTPRNVDGDRPDPIEDPEKTENLDRTETTHPGLEQVETAEDFEGPTTDLRARSAVDAHLAIKRSRTRADLEAAYAIATLVKEPTRPITPQVTSDGTILVDWYTEGDQENPQNWSLRKKIFISVIIYMYTGIVYLSSSIVTPSTPGIMKEFGVSVEAASWTLSLYVLAYGIGPLIWSPLTEIPSVGRNPPYILTMAMYVILTVPTALVKNFAGLLVLRFLQGFFGSPCLATGGATLSDMYSPIKVTYALCLWALSASCGPALGPIISGFSVPAENWRWSIWEILWGAGPVFVMMTLFLPETATPTILLRRAQRLRKLTGDSRLMSQSEIDQRNTKPKEVVFEALVRPIQLIVMDPAIGFSAAYVGLVYAIFYSFFEAFPLVYLELYNFNWGEMGLIFVSIPVGTTSSMLLYWAYVYYKVEPDILSRGLGAPERRLLPSVITSFFLPAGLFWFAWTGNGHIHWLSSAFSIVPFAWGVYILIQCIFVYLPMSYPQYAASLFAGNDFARSSFAFAAIMFSRPMFLKIGIGPAVSLLGALTAGCIGGIFILYFFGDRLRARSKFAAK